MQTQDGADGFTAVDVDNRIMTITLNRPDRRNAMTRQAVREICSVLDDADARDDVGAVIFTGAGDTYCVGADLSGGPRTFATRDPAAADDPDRRRDYGGILSLRIFACLKPVVAAVNGDAVGLGSTMLLPMDARIASGTARFGFVFTRRGIAPEACSSWFLPRVVGIATALRWTLGGDLLDAAEALESGLVQTVCEPDELIATARERAQQLMGSGSPIAVATTRRMLWQGLGMTHPMQAHRMESSVLTVLGKGPDAQEGVAAFLEKRRPVFTDSPSRAAVEFDTWWPTPEFEE